MIRFTTTILQFNEQGEKTGWTYIEIPANIAQQLKPGNKKSFRVKGLLDNYAIEAVALMPMGGGNFIMALNAGIRKGIKKRRGITLTVQLEVDNEPIKLPAELTECLADEPAALAFFNTLARSHQTYFIKWIASAKTEPTRIKRIAQVINALSKKYDFGLMLRNAKQERDILMGR
ncbi:MAG TPA: YdeI/OmpD-associated family protein [Panacibacter sp.]|nr:YdeI/OmpD-associated family protein [Panacibacter sp.]